DRAMAFLVYPLLFLWALRIIPEAVNRVRNAIHVARWSTVDGFFLVGLWAAVALAFHFTIPLSDERYATSIVVFAWPGIVAEVENRRKPIIWLALAVCCIATLARSSRDYAEWITQSVPDAHRMMSAMLHNLPAGTREVYVVPAGSLQGDNPEYMRLVLGLPTTIVRLADIEWNCSDPSDLITFDHDLSDGVVNMSVTLPPC